MERIVTVLTASVIIKLVVVGVVMDTIFGAGRALKEHQFNSSVGIDGAIRKISMLLSLVFLAVVDTLIHINLIGFIPEEARNYLPASISVIGLAEFFGLLYLCYEIVSILKNMTLCGLPVKKLWVAVQAFLGKYTAELPDTEKEDAEQEAAARNSKIVATNQVPEGALHENKDGTLNVYDADGNVVGKITKEQADAMAAAVTEVVTE